MPEGVVCVTRGTRWGNLFTAAQWGEYATGDVRTFLANAFRFWLMLNPEGQSLAGAARTELEGKDLACFCPLDGRPCHADALLEAARGQLCRDWLIDEKMDWVIHVMPDGRAFRSVVHDYPVPCCFQPLATATHVNGRIVYPPIPRRLSPGFTVLGAWPSREAAFDAALDQQAMRGVKRLCNLGDIDRARRERARLEKLTKKAR